MAKEITSDGITTTIKDNGITQTISDGNYSADTQNTSKIHSQSGRVESATSRNVETNGNSQEYCWTRGVTCEANVKVVGNPDQFEGSNLRKIHNHLKELAGLLVQRGDNSRSLTLPKLPTIDFKKIVSKMSSSTATSLSIPTPNIKSWEDIPIHAAKIASYIQTVGISNTMEQAARAAALEIERQAMQQAINIKHQAKNMKDQLEIKPAAGSESTQDLDEIPEYNIDRKTVYGTIDFELLTELEKNV